MRGIDWSSDKENARNAIRVEPQIAVSIFHVHAMGCGPARALNRRFFGLFLAIAVLSSQNGSV